MIHPIKNHLASGSVTVDSVIFCGALRLRIIDYREDFRCELVTNEEKEVLMEQYPTWIRKAIESGFRYNIDMVYRLRRDDLSDLELKILKKVQAAPRTQFSLKKIREELGIDDLGSSIDNLWNKGLVKNTHGYVQHSTKYERMAELLGEN